MENEYVARVRAYAEKEGNRVIPICAKLEEEVASSALRTPANSSKRSASKRPASTA